MLDGTINLTTLEQWLEKQLQIIFNPLSKHFSYRNKKQQTK